MQVRLVSFTALSDEMKAELPSELHSPDGLMAYCARVSSPHQESPKYAGLLKYCASHKHWSVFELADMTVEVTTSRAISQQALRHQSFSFQEFSLRYAEAIGFETYEARRQDVKNRQNSIDDMDMEDKIWFLQAQKEVQWMAKLLYEDALSRGIAKEQARFLLPLSTTTKFYMKGSVRSWIHYLQVRADAATQKEHRDIAVAIMELFKVQFPITAEALEWTVSQ